MRTIRILAAISVARKPWRIRVERILRWIALPEGKHLSRTSRVTDVVSASAPTSNSAQRCRGFDDVEESRSSLGIDASTARPFARLQSSRIDDLLVVRGAIPHRPRFPRSR
jgi:hypothetical protein